MTLTQTSPLDYLARGFLTFSDGIIIIPILVLGFIFINRHLFFHAACLAMLSILLNIALKVSYQVPLSPTLAKVGFAFPSGHMQLATVFYGWLAYKFHNKVLTILTAVLLIGIALSLIHFGYHTLPDVLAAIPSAFLIIAVHDIFISKWPEKAPWYLLVISTLLLGYIHLRYRIPPYGWNTYYLLLGLCILGWLLTLLSKKPPK